MAHRLVEIAVEERLRTAWSGATPIYVENVAEEPPADGGAYLNLQFPFSTAERWAVNQRFYREEGGIRIVINVPHGTGKQQIQDWGETLSTLFCDVKFSGVECKVPAPVFVDDSIDGPYIWGAVVIPYTFNFTRA